MKVRTPSTVQLPDKDSPQTAGCHRQGCLAPWCLVRRPRWTWQPADPSRTLSGRTPPASSCRGEAKQPLVESTSEHHVRWNIKEIRMIGGVRGVNGRGGAERRFSLMVCEVCRFCMPAVLGPDGRTDEPSTGGKSLSSRAHTVTGKFMHAFSTRFNY